MSCCKSCANSQKKASSSAQDDEIGAVRGERRIKICESELERDGYRRSFGMYSGRHWRREKNGQYEHVRIDEMGRAFYHTDREKPGSIAHLAEALEHMASSFFGVK